MQQMTQNYRNDDVADLPLDIKEYLDEHYLPQVENLDKQNPKVLVVFSGGNAAGKSHLSQHLKQELGAVVRDGVIDWYFDRILPVFEQQGYQIFIIGYDVSKERRIELINKRGDKQTISTGRLVNLIEEQNVHIARFREQYTPDIVLTDDNMFDYAPVVAKLREKLTALQ